MEAIKGRYALPIMPPSQNEIQTIYPWENINILNDIRELYKIVIKTGYEGNFKQFQSQLGSIIQQEAAIINPDEYVGTYVVTPLPIMSSILRTENKVLRYDVIIEPIPYAITSNLAGGYTATIG